MTIFQFARTSLTVTWAMRRSARPNRAILSGSSPRAAGASSRGARANRRHPQRLVLLVGEVLEQGPRLLTGEVDEDEPLPDVEVDGPERGRRAVDLVLLDHGSGDQRPVERVAPGVVGAAQVAAHRALLVVADARAAVPADVVEGAELLVLAADHQQALVGELHPHPVAGPGHAFGASDVDPVAVEDPLLVEGVGLLGVVGRPGQRLADRTRHPLTVQSVSRRVTGAGRLLPGNRHA